MIIRGIVFAAPGSFRYYNINLFQVIQTSIMTQNV